MKLKVDNKKVIDFVRKNTMTSFFVADGPRKLGPWARQNLGHHNFPYKVKNL
jgi:hypothetical protein